MTGFALIAAVLLACPKDVAQIHWADFSYSFNAAGKKFVVEGSLYDRKADGKPSSGDLFKITGATANGSPLGLDELWVTVTGGLATQMARTFKRSKGVKARCESRFKVEGVPRMGSPAALGRYLAKLGAGPKVSRRDQAEADIKGWADDICGQGRHVSEEELAQTLFERASRRHGAVGKGHLKQMAKETARENAMRCAHFTKPKLTYGD